MSDETMNKPIDTDKLAGNTVLTVLARLSMLVTPVLVGAALWFGSEWLDGRFEAQAHATAIVDAKVQDLPLLRERVVVLETNQKQTEADREDFQRQTFARLDRMQDAIVTLSNTVAGLTATIKADRENDR